MTTCTWNTATYISVVCDKHPAGCSARCDKATKRSPFFLYERDDKLGLIYIYIYIYISSPEAGANAWRKVEGAMQHR